jgi:hypothetical protein
MSRLRDARRAFVDKCTSQTIGDIHTVTFQPKPDRICQDRHVVEVWYDITNSNSPWIFLAVFDGKLPSDTRIAVR